MSATGAPRQRQTFFSSHIIAILAAILFPVFAKAREKARQSSCSSNLKQMAMGSKMYSQDYDEKSLPMHAYGANGGRVWFQGLMYPYVKNWQLFECPSYNNTAWYAPATAGVPNSTPCTSEPQSIRFRTGIGRQWFRADASGTDAGYWNGPLADAAVLWPAELVEFCDSDCIVAGPHYAADLPGWLNGAWPGGLNRHNSGMNASFYDGHVKWVKASQLGMRNVYYAAP